MNTIKNAHIYAHRGWSQRNGIAINHIGIKYVERYHNGRKIIVKTVENIIYPTPNATYSKNALIISSMLS